MAEDGKVTVVPLEGKQPAAAEEKVFKATEVFAAESSSKSKGFKATLALALWLGAIHFNGALMLFAFLFLPLSKALLFVSLSLSLSELS